MLTFGQFLTIAKTRYLPIFAISILELSVLFAVSISLAYAPLAPRLYLRGIPARIPIATWMMRPSERSRRQAKEAERNRVL